MLKYRDVAVIVVVAQGCCGDFTLRNMLAFVHHSLPPDGVRIIWMVPREFEHVLHLLDHGVVVNVEAHSRSRVEVTPLHI